MHCYLDAKEKHTEAEMLREIFADTAFMNFLQTDLDEGGVFFSYDLPNHTHMTYKWYYLIKLYHEWRDFGKVDHWIRNNYMRCTEDHGYKAERWEQNAPEAVT